MDVTRPVSTFVSLYLVFSCRCTDVLFRGSLDCLEKLSDEEVDATFKGMKIYHAILEPTTTVYDIAVKIKVNPAYGNFYSTKERKY